MGMNTGGVAVEPGRYAAVPWTVLRVGAGLLFMQHGVQKLFGWLGGFGGTPGNTAELWSLMGLAGVLEVFGGGLIVLGLLTRPVAVVLAVEMIWAYVSVHLPQSPFPILNGGEPALLFLLIWIAMAAIGAGPYSGDALVARRR